jgi:hypothetical protein
VRAEARAKAQAEREATLATAEDTQTRQRARARTMRGPRPNGATKFNCYVFKHFHNQHQYLRKLTGRIPTVSGCTGRTLSLLSFFSHRAVGGPKKGTWPINDFYS